jgi:hypothetical protein
MEAMLYRQLYRLVFSVAHPPRRPRELYCDRWIALMYFWSVIHDKPAEWASVEGNWPDDGKVLEGRLLASQSRLSRRLRTVGVIQVIERLISAVSERFGVPLVKLIDSKPLTVGAYSKDRDAKRGRLADGVFGRGYRLHVIAHGRAPRRFTLLPLNEHDTVGAAILLPTLEGGGGYAVGDNAYDTNECHRDAAATGHQLVAPPRECNKGVRDVKYNGPERLRGLDLIDSPLETCGEPSAFGSALYGFRQRIESAFGEMTLKGLGALPAWVRGARRVALWAAAKVLLYLWRLAQKEGLMT